MTDNHIFAHKLFSDFIIIYFNVSVNIFYRFIYANRFKLNCVLFENVLLNISRFLHGPLSYQSLQSQEIKISGIKIFLNVLLKILDGLSVVHKMPRVGIALNVQPLIVSSGLYVMFSKTNCSGFSGGNASLNLT